MVSDDDDDDDDDEDDTEALLAELEQIKKERAEEMLRMVNFLLKNLLASHGVSYMIWIACTSHLI